ncbi:hypothetical protein [Actinomadura litoris]|uniref:hypothetical protein n=1 Tax=Actinomadura litoris TaxID=2678616 RepID=UPI001FA7E929|nr:hypothetical protein [Actinomadura litoris]
MDEQLKRVIEMSPAELDGLIATMGRGMARRSAGARRAAATRRRREEKREQARHAAEVASACTTCFMVHAGECL